MEPKAATVLFHTYWTEDVTAEPNVEGLEAIRLATEVVEAVVALANDMNKAPVA